MKRSCESLEYTVLPDPLFFLIIMMATELILASITSTHATNILGTERILSYIFNVHKTEFLAKIVKKKFHYTL